MENINKKTGGFLKLSVGFTCAEGAFQLLNINFAHLAEQKIFLCDISNLHRFTRMIVIGRERHSDEVRAVQLLANDTRAKGIATKS